MHFEYSYTTFIKYIGEFLELFIKVDFLLLIIASIFFYLFYKEQFLFCKKFYGQLPNPFKKFNFLFFLFFFCIPAKIFVNNSIPKIIFKVFINGTYFLIITYSNYDPFLLYLSFFAVFEQTAICCFLLGTFSLYKNFIINKNFNGNSEFAEFAFTFFFSNTSSYLKLIKDKVFAFLPSFGHYLEVAELKEFKIKAKITTDIFYKHSLEESYSHDEKLDAFEQFLTSNIQNYGIITPITLPFRKLFGYLVEDGDYV